MTPEEREAMEHLIAFMECARRMGLRVNEAEAIAAIHVLQGFIAQHALHRLAPEAWSAWYGELEARP